MKHLLGKHVLATITYYDAIEFPLTSFEVWRYLVNHTDEIFSGSPIHISEIEYFLRHLVQEGKIHEEDGFYMLLYRNSDFVRERIRRDKISVTKLKRMRRLLSWLTWVPFVRMVGATGSLAMKHANKGSDWDMFVVLASGRIWSGRTLLTTILHLIGKRRHGRKIRNRACLNYFVTETSLQIGTKDLYSAHEYSFFIPLIGTRLAERFFFQNHWIARFKPNMLPEAIPHRLSIARSPQTLARQQFLEHGFAFAWLERWLASWQRAKILRNPKSAQEGSLIEASDEALIFLPSPRGPKVFAAFKKRLTW